MRSWLAGNLLYMATVISVLMALTMVGITGFPYWLAVFGMIMCYIAGQKNSESRFNVKLLDLAKEKNKIND